MMNQPCFSPQEGVGTYSTFVKLQELIGYTGRKKDDVIYDSFNELVGNLALNDPVEQKAQFHSICSDFSGKCANYANAVESLKCVAETFNFPQRSQDMFEGMEPKDVLLELKEFEISSLAEFIKPDFSYDEDLLLKVNQGLSSFSSEYSRVIDNLEKCEENKITDEMEKSRNFLNAMAVNVLKPAHDHLFNLFNNAVNAAVSVHGIRG